ARTPGSLVPPVPLVLLTVVGVRRVRWRARRARDGPRGAVRGVAWGAGAEECEANALWMIRTAEAFLADHGKEQPFGVPLAGYGALEAVERQARAAALAPVIRSLASQDRPQVGHFTDTDVVLDFLAHDQ
ncbi:hypothetical protein ACPXCX_52565, partial [Streptomyces sp. DT225]